MEAPQKHESRMFKAPATCQYVPLGDLISNNTLFTVFCGPQTHPNYRPAQRTPRYKEPQSDLSVGCHYAYSRTYVMLARPRARLVRVDFSGQRVGTKDTASEAHRMQEHGASTRAEEAQTSNIGIFSVLCAT